MKNDYGNGIRWWENKPVDDIEQTIWALFFHIEIF